MASWAPMGGRAPFLALYGGDDSRAKAIGGLIFVTSRAPDVIAGTRSSS